MDQHSDISSLHVGELSSQHEALEEVLGLLYIDGLVHKTAVTPLC